MDNGYEEKAIQKAYASGSLAQAATQIGRSDTVAKEKQAIGAELDDISQVIEAIHGEISKAEVKFNDVLSNYPESERAIPDLPFRGSSRVYEQLHQQLINALDAVARLQNLRNKSEA